MQAIYQCHQQQLVTADFYMLIYSDLFGLKITKKVRYIKIIIHSLMFLDIKFVCYPVTSLDDMDELLNH